MAGESTKQRARSARGPRDIVETTVVDGGLTIVTEHMPDVLSVSLGFWVGTGSVDEPEPREAIAHARSLGLLVIADGKRGDIDVTARAYASALIDGSDSPFGRIAGIGADLTTVNPLMGSDAVEPFVSAARRAGTGVLVLVRTSNPGAADIEDLRLEGSGTVWERSRAICSGLAS